MINKLTNEIVGNPNKETPPFLKQYGKGARNLLTPFQDKDKRSRLQLGYKGVTKKRAAK